MKMDWDSVGLPVFEYSNPNLTKQIRLKSYIKDIYISEFSTEWERNILNLIPYIDKQEHCAFIKLILNEIKQLYAENMKDFILKSILSCKVYMGSHIACERCNVSSDLKYNIVEENIMYNRAIFLKYHHLFSRKYFLSCPIIRYVVDTAYCILPTIICDLRCYHELGILTLYDFQNMIFKDIKKGALIITNQFYTKTFKALQRSRILKNISTKRLSQLMRCLTNIFVQQILDVMMRSVDHIINIMKDAHYCPQIEFQLVYEDDQLVTKPSIKEVFSTYHDIVRNIEAIAQELIPLEEWLNIKGQGRYIKIVLPDWFIEKSHNNLQEILEALFRPINEHITSISVEFGNVCASNVRNRILSLTSRQTDFDMYLMHIHKYNEYLSKIKSMASNLYYTVGKLEQSSAKESLKQICCHIIDVLTMELVKYHQHFNRSINSDFEDMKSTALDIPMDAKPLIQLGDYMSQASKVLIKQLEEKVEQSVYMLSKLLEITTLTDKHIDLNKTTINWLHIIQPVFAQSNTLCEAMKSELEEDLQRRINALNSEVDAMFPQLVILDDMDDISRMGEYREYYKDLMKRYNEMNNKMQVINSEEKLFKFPETEFPKMSELKETIVPFYSLICIVYQWQKDNSVWLNGPFECLDASVIGKKTVNYFEEITEMSRTLKSRIKMDATTNKSYKFSGIADDPDPMQQPAPLKLCWQTLNDINKFKIYLPLVVCMCNPALKSRHWEEMSAICDFDLTPNAGTTLRKMMEMNLMDNIDKYTAISLGANKELRLQQQLTEMVKEWEPISFIMFIAESGAVMFKYTEEIEALLREHLIKLEQMRASHFVKSILSDLINFSTLLVNIQESLDQWTRIQYRKLYLEPIFSYPDIEIRLTQETALYLEVTRILLDISNRFAENPSFQEFKRSLDLLDILYEASEKLEKVSKGVRDYLEIKKMSFTRFFFLADTEIQKILFETNHITKRHTLVTKCFTGIEQVKLSKSNCIQDIIGYYGESLHFNDNDEIPINTECEEEWLIQLERKMKDAIRENIIRYYPLINEDLVSIPIDNINMAIVCGFQLYWTSSVEKCIRSLNITSLESLFMTYTNWMTWISSKLKNDLTRKHRSLLMSLIIVMSTHKEIVRFLLDKNIMKQTEFEWIAQLRYYCHDKNIEISIFDATIKYGYEYNYFQQNIINTPLTDRCFRTIMQAYRYHLYGGIVGPTGTGKTETIKNLTRALAMPFYVVNCNDSISYECMTQIFKGIVSCGAWVCFESFDRLKLQLLSAIAQNLLQMKQAISTNLRSISFDGCSLSLNVSGNICVTINSEQSRYFYLPDNLKVLFRTISTTIPDINRISEIELFAGGFVNAKNLALKLTTSYKLISEHLGGNRHYNFSTSSLRTIIATAVSMKQGLPNENEYTLLLRSIIDVSIPQLCNADILIFQSIMQDIFPESVVLPFDCSAILNALESVCAKRSLTSHKIFKLKIIQIIELMYVHRALVLVSDPLGGKTEILHTLAETLSLLHEQGNKIGAKVKIDTVIPGVMNSNKLFGHFRDENGTWQDGLCTVIFRRYMKDMSANRKWLIFDGSLNGTWIENLYTVLDENKMLYLLSGERLPVTESMSIIFETTSMMEISPNLISRCGMIYIDSPSIGWKPYVLSHIAKHDIYNGYDKILRSLFDWAIDSCLNFLNENGDILTNQELHLVTSMLNIFEILLRDACEEGVEAKEENNHFITWAQAALILAIVWGLGGNLINDPQIRFNTFCVSLWNGTNTKYPKPDTIKHLDITLPNEGLIQDNLYIFEGIGNWKYWGDLLKNEKIPEVCNFNQIYVPSINSIKYHYIFLKHIKYRKPFLLYGDVAVGKTNIMYDLLTNKLPENCLHNSFSFTSMTSVTRTQRSLLSKLNKIRRTSYGPGRDKYCVNFVDDINAIVIERSEMQSIFELFRQLLSYGYCYDTNELNKVFIQDIIFTFAITGKIEGGISSRFWRHFNTYAIPVFTTDNIFRIYSNVLLANLKKNLFAADVIGNVTNITNATIEIYKSVIKILRPVPSKLYYCFDLRDVSRVINGCSLIQKESVETKTTFIRLWVHEVLRVFNDRMLDRSDKEWLFLTIRDTVKNNFKDSFEVAFDHLPKSQNNQLSSDSFNDLMFGNFMNTEKSGKCKRYEEITSMDILKNKIIAYLNEYNNNFKKKINLVVSRYMLEFLIKISRIIASPGGNMLLISSIGSGRKSMITLAAFMQQQSFFETTVQSYYNMDTWKDNLRKVLRQCGALQKDVTYFMSEGRMTDIFLSDISCLMSTGELPDLFSSEDRQSIIEITRLRAQGGDRNAEISARSVMTYFANQCKNRLHFMLCSSPTRAAFRMYSHSYPNLLKHCTVNCYLAWPDQALVEIAVRYIRHVNVPTEIKSHIAKAIAQFHNNAREMSLKYCEMFGRTTHVTSSAFLHMLKLYTRLMSKKQEEIIEMRSRYIAGLEKLKLAAEQVEKMKTTLMILKPQLELSAKQTVITMQEVEKENIIVERATILVKQEGEIANRKTEIAGTLRSECEADLAIAIPILEDAINALNTLKPTDITLVKAMKNPPDTVKLVMAAVCVMLGVFPDRTVDPVTGKKFTDYWGPSKRILSDMNFLQNLKDYDKDDIAPSVMQVIKKTYMTDNSFMPHIVAKASSAAEGLCKWVRAMVSYDDVAKVVAPKKEKLIAAQAECDEAEAFLNDKRQTLAALNAKLAALHDSLRQTLQKKLNLETEVATCTAKLVKAEKLIASLEGEKNRWIQSAHNLQTNYENLVGDMLLSCGIVAYMSFYNISFRDKILTEWKKFIEILEIPYTKTYNFVSVLGVEIEIDYWQLCGLSKNRLAIENTIILNNSEMWCLFIDSQNQINQWIKKIEKNNNLKVIKLTDVDYMSVIVQNIENGVPVLLENVGEKLEIALEPILLKDIYKDETWYIDIGTKPVKYSQNFRFYITTRLSNPNYTADIFNKLLIIDFSLPNGTLRDNLLDIVVSKEKPELQERYEALRIQNATDKKILQQQEDKILSTLLSTSINILEDEHAIQVLDSSKALTTSIMAKQEAANAMAEHINKFRDAYFHLADHCAELFCTLDTLSNLNHMYRFSFSWFIQLYITSIETSNKSVILHRRLQFLKSSFTRNLHFSVCRSLFETHKLLYSFLLCVKILIDTRQTTQEEVRFFISSNVENSDIIPEENPIWLSMETWKQICMLSNIVSTLRELPNDFRVNTEAWEKYCKAIPFQSHLMPKPWSSNLTPFQKLILIKIIRYDKITVEITRLIEDTMGDVFNSCPHRQISESYAESNCLTPIIFILPCYSPPLSLVSAYAGTKGCTSKLISLSMDDGHRSKAESLVEQARTEGGWVFLQNCHHASRWIPRLEQICEGLNVPGTSSDFRLWLSSRSIPEFPISILHNSVKIAHDYPLQLKQSMLRVYRSEPVRNEEFFEGCPGRDREFSKLLYGLCFFHTIVRDRKHFGPQGWNTPYNFEYTDLEMSIVQLRNFINKSEDIPFNTLLYLIGECNYGGKIVDMFDQRCLRCLLYSFCNSHVVNNSAYSFSNCTEHSVPQRCEYRDIIKHINNIQLDTPAETFASDENAIIIKDTTAAREFMKSLSLLDQIRLSNNEIVEIQILGAVDAIDSRLPGAFNINEIREKYPFTSGEPLNVLLIHEAELINKILLTIADSLTNLRSALNGDTMLTETLEDLAKEIYNNKVPRVWRTTDVGIATNSLPDYIGFLLKRANFVQHWHDNGLPRVIHFDSLCCCKRFLSAALLLFSRRRRIPVEHIISDFKVASNDIEHSEENDEDAYCICGLYLCGARWDMRRHLLTDSLTNIFWHNMPPIHLTFSTEKKAVVNDVYECPVYISPTRHDETNSGVNFSIIKNYVTTVPLKSAVSQAYWTKRGTALFCQIEQQFTRSKIDLET